MRSLAVVCALFAATACGGHRDGQIDDVIGAACTRDDDCAERCFIDPNDLPQGFCSVRCVSDNDCPDDTYCMAENEGICMFACPEFDCSRLGLGWFCRERSRINGAGTVHVCSGD